MDFDASRPIWLQLREEFTRRIVIGRWAPGKQIPGVRELAVELGVNPNTVQRTLAELERDGLCRSERAVGGSSPMTRNAFPGSGATWRRERRTSSQPG